MLVLPATADFGVSLLVSAWAAFAATGNPSSPELKWAATNPETNKTMVWDNECRMVDDPEGDARKIILA